MQKGPKKAPGLLGWKGGFVTLVELALQTLHLRLVPAHAVNALGAQAWGHGGLGK